MDISPFTYIPSLIGQPMLVRIEQEDEKYSVKIGDAFLGTMVQDDEAEFGWKTDDALLLEELPELSMAIREQEAISNLPHAIKEMFPNDLTGWDWAEDESLKLIARPETDLEEFACVIRDQINEVVLFEKDLTVYLGQEGNSEVKEIQINS